MHRLSVITGLALATFGAMLLENRPATPLQQHLRAEQHRLERHFDSVITALTARDVSYLSAEQRMSRTRLIAWLRDYRDGAAFPLNDGVSPQSVPIFRDSRGVLCAMAYLIQRSRAEAIVDDVATARNTATIYELADDPRLISWLDGAGLTVDEAARIQPTYGAPGDRNRVDADYALVSLALSGSAIATFGFNMVSPSPASGLLGFLAGGVALANGIFGALGQSDSDGTQKLAAANSAIGVASIAMAFRGILASKKPSAPAATGKLDRISFAPTVSLLGKPQLGFALSARF